MPLRDGERPRRTARIEPVAPQFSGQRMRHTEKGGGAATGRADAARVMVDQGS